MKKERIKRPDVEGDIWIRAWIGEGETLEEVFGDGNRESMESHSMEHALSLFVYMHSMRVVIFQ